MGATRVFGLETEYGYTHLPEGGSELPRPKLLALIQELAKDTAPCVPAMDGRGVFLASGSRMYLDWTSTADKPEFSTAECCDPVVLVRSIQDGDEFMDRLAQRVEEHIGGQMLFSKTNVDYDSRNTWGCHESYSIRRGVDFQEDLIPFLCSRVIFTGAGGFNNLSHGAEFLLSPRAPHIQRISGFDTQSNRPIINTRDESFSPKGEFRIHLILGEGPLGETSMLLKSATTALVVGLSEVGLHPGGNVRLKNPLGALRRFASDPSCQATARLEPGGRARAIDIQRHYRQLALQNLEALPVWAEAVCTLWGQTLDRLESREEQRVPRLDWVIRRHVIERYLHAKGISWEALADSDSIKDFAEVRAELCELDTKLGRIGKAGLFHMLDSQGFLQHKVDTTALPPDPRRTRAAVRGAAIQHAWDQGIHTLIRGEWNYLFDGRNGSRLLLHHALDQTTAWAPAEMQPVAPIPEDRFRLSHDPNCGVGLEDVPF